jgi:hypothetical protein
MAIPYVVPDRHLLEPQGPEMSECLWVMTI